MKAVILAGGLGTRLSEETHSLPKPMVEIGGRPIIWHIMKSLSSFGINEFIICCGYKGYVIKEYFANYHSHISDFTVDLKSGIKTNLTVPEENWTVSLIDTGQDTQTGGRIKRVSSMLNETFLMTYGDGVCDVNIQRLISFHKLNNKLATVTAVQPPGRFGVLNIKDNLVDSFAEKPAGDGSWINGGFFILEPSVIRKIQNDKTVWEHEPLEDLAAEGQIAAFKHEGFWRPMDTLRDKHYLNDLWDDNKAPWKIW